MGDGFVIAGVAGAATVAGVTPIAAAVASWLGVHPAVTMRRATAPSDNDTTARKKFIV
jgi:hypothetical protein